MRFLLTSAGIKNTSIHAALVDLLGKPIAESSALCIPTGVQPFPGGPSHVYGFLTGTVGGPMCALGWKSLGVLELTALPTIKKEHWVPAFQEVDARRAERLRVGHQMDLRNRHAVLGIEKAADLEDLLHGVLTGAAFRAGQHGLLVVI